MILHYKNFSRIKHALFFLLVSFCICSFSNLKASNHGGNDSLVSLYKTPVSINDQKNLIKNMTEEELYAFIDKTFDLDSIPLDLINEINMAAAIFKQKENSFENIVIALPPVIGTLPQAPTSYQQTSLKKTEKLIEIIKLETFEKNVAQLQINNSSFIPTTELIAVEKTIELTKVQTLAMPTTQLTENSLSNIPNMELIAVEKTVEIIKVETLDMPSAQLALNNSSNFPNLELRAQENIQILEPINKLSKIEKQLEEETPTAAVAFELIPNEIIIIEEKTNAILSSELAPDEIAVTETESVINEEQSIAELPQIIETNSLVTETTTAKETPLLASSEPVHPTNKVVREGIYKPANLTVSESQFSSPAPVLNLNVPSTDYYVSWEINKLFPENDMLKMKKDTSITLVLLSQDHHKYFHPFNGPVTSGFGWRDSAQHNGIDIDLNKGDKVSAAFDGMVRVARRYGSFGNVVIIRHYNGLETVYAHLSKIKVKPGQLVSSGDLVGLGGSTGHSTGSHLHFEVRFKGVPINPKYLISLTEQKIMCDEFTCKKTKWGLAVFPKNTKLYTVEKGDTIFEIAKRFGTTTASIKEMNHLNGGKVRLKAGQLINVAQ